MENQDKIDMNRITEPQLESQYSKVETPMFYVREVVPDYSRSELSWISKGIKRLYESYGPRLLQIEKRILNLESDKYPTTLYDSRLAQNVHQFVMIVRNATLAMGKELDREELSHIMTMVFTPYGPLDVPNRMKVTDLNVGNYGVNDLGIIFEGWTKNF
jgi:hypothetical protein